MTDVEVPVQNHSLKYVGAAACVVLAIAAFAAPWVAFSEAGVHAVSVSLSGRLLDVDSGFDSFEAGEAGWALGYVGVVGSLLIRIVGSKTDDALTGNVFLAGVVLAMMVVAVWLGRSVWLDLDVVDDAGLSPSMAWGYWMSLGAAVSLIVVPFVVELAEGGARLAVGIGIVAVLVGGGALIGRPDIGAVHAGAPNVRESEISSSAENDFPVDEVPREIESSVEPPSVVEEPAVEEIPDSNDDVEAPAPEPIPMPGPPTDVTVPAGFEWRVQGPFASSWTCDQTLSRWPIAASVCFTHNGYAYFWGLAQS
ncbi:hypothetical protein [Gordonia spumicola]|uniref:hypothetical protein n=1 Tax=Gordonia spumicola TaxID=589161 RepID=UPI001379CECD|nr:hypothetical protein [Gordonia spumicola]